MDNIRGLSDIAGWWRWHASRIAGENAPRVLVPPRTTHPTHEERSARGRQAKCKSEGATSPSSSLNADPYAAMGEHQEASSAELTRSFLSFRMLKEALQSTNIKDDEEVGARLYLADKWC
ncbi:hypothetical protein ON010_g9896 [Phytophthora cinnamomi]|nr:hypothetical protein ON010_g9896 [Phytophthora cinnamomi]